MEADEMNSQRTAGRGDAAVGSRAALPSTQVPCIEALWQQCQQLFVPYPSKLREVSVRDERYIEELRKSKPLGPPVDSDAFTHVLWLQHFQVRGSFTHSSWSFAGEKVIEASPPPLSGTTVAPALQPPERRTSARVPAAAMRYDAEADRLRHPSFKQLLQTAAPPSQVQSFCAPRKTTECVSYRPQAAQYNAANGPPLAIAEPECGPAPPSSDRAIKISQLE
ncbi:hypothetical protein TgHK011_001023 [Trichoderma gracile]|nr:hypothetical protein TgHK011_001023 [Trichoderma gracile]